MADPPTDISPFKWSVSLPYFDNNDPLIKIPTKAMIHASQDIIKENMTSKVVGVGRQFVVKYGRGLDLIEGQNAIWVATHTGIRVPKIYALYEDSEDEIKYIIMERLPGATLEEAWPSMSNAQKIWCANNSEISCKNSEHCHHQVATAVSTKGHSQKVSCISKEPTKTHQSYPAAHSQQNKISTVR